MELSVDEYIEGLFSKEAFEQPSDTVKPEDLEMRIPKWFDEEKFNKARRFYWYNGYQITTSMLLGLVAVLAVPSILKVLISSRRSNSNYTAYRRYASTLLHTISWFEHDLKPGSISWRSLMTVRSRHIKASMSASVKGQGLVSQRDLALTQFGFMGFSMLKPDKFALKELEDGDWDAYVHFWRVIGHAIGLEDKYNVCRKNVDETLQVCHILQDRVFTPSLENVPEYYEHMACVMLDGLWCVNPTINVETMIYLTKYLCNVPGYIYTEDDRINMQDLIRKKLDGKSPDTGVESTAFLSDSLIEIHETKPRLLYLHDYDSYDTVPEYKKLSLAAKWKLAINAFFVEVNKSVIGRIYLNWNYKITIFLMKYFPFLAFGRFGFINSFTNIFCEDPIDEEIPKPNSEYYKEKPPVPKYKEYLSLLWDMQ